MGKLELIRLRNSNQAVLEILNFGATVVGLKVPDKVNNLTNVILGLDDPKDYVDNDFQNKGLFLGSTVGRYAGRISNGNFTIDKKKYILNTVEGVHLHGGNEGFDKKFWNIDYVDYGKNPFVVLSYVSQHLEEGYPGNLRITVKYQLTENNTFNIEYKATTDEVTHVNLTNHSYFNLNGEDSIFGHDLYINSTKYLDVDAKLIPSGKLKETHNSGYCFIQPSMLDANFKGLDDTFVLNNEMIKGSLYSRRTGILMKITTNQPAMVVFTPEKMNELTFKDDKKYNSFPSICFETQKFPDAPNHSHFPSTLLTPQEEYINRTSFQFYIA